jgi:hypothetical protein
MDFKSYQEKKSEFDNNALIYIAKRVFEDYDETDACHLDIIDGTGNINNNPNPKDKWAYTGLDNFITFIKQSIGSDQLRSFFRNYAFVKDLDPLFVISKGNKVDFEEIRETLGNIVTKVQDKSYLPDYLYHDDESIHDIPEHLNFNDLACNALTIATFLLYALRKDSVPTSIDFDYNIKRSVELTFNMRPIGEYDECLRYCIENKLIESDKVSSEGIRLIVEIAQELEGSDLLSTDKHRIENQTANWKKLGKMYL